MFTNLRSAFRRASVLGVMFAASVALVACGGGSSAPSLKSIAVTAASAQIIPTGTTQLTVTGTYSDNSTKTLTTTATYSSSATGVATVSAAGLVTGVAGGTATITATESGVSGTVSITVAPTLSSIKVTAASGSVVAGSTDQLTVVGTYSDNSTKTLTGNSVYTSSLPAVATVAAGGLVTGVAAGTTSITVTATDPTTSTTATSSITLFGTQLSACCQGSSAFQLFASSFQVYAAKDANNAYVHSVQGGDVFATAGNNGGLASKFTYAQGSSNPSTNSVQYTGYYQIGWTVSAPLVSSDYAVLSMLAPTFQYSTATGGAGLATATPVDISQSSQMVIRMGNVLFGGSTGAVNTFTVQMTNGGQTDTCSADVTVNNAMNTYTIPFTSFTCTGTPGTLSDLQATGVSQVSVLILGAKNTGVAANETDAIAVQYVSFDQPATPSLPSSGTLASGYNVLASEIVPYTVANGVPNSCGGSCVYYTDSLGGSGATPEGGNLKAVFTTNYGYGCYAGFNLNFYVLQVQAGGLYCGGGPSTYVAGAAGEYVGVTVSAPRAAQASVGTPGAIIPVDISLSNNLLVRMGNSYAPNPGVGGTANVFSVAMSDGATINSTNVCSANVTLLTIGTNGSTTPNSNTGLLDYEVPFSQFTTCTSGSLAGLKAKGVQSVSVGILASQNPNVQNLYFDQIAVSTIGFTQ